MTKRNVSMLAAAAAFVSSAVIAGPVDLTGEMFQYGDSMYTWDKESGGAVRVGAVWDGFSSAPETKLGALFQEGDYIFQRDGAGRAVKVGAIWDGRVAGSVSSGASTLALKR